MPEAYSLYMDLLKRSLAGMIYDPRLRGPVVTEAQFAELLRAADEEFKAYLRPLNHTVESFLGISSQTLCQLLNSMHPDIAPDTMTDMTAIDNVQFCTEQVIQNNVPGDLIETGVWKGGLPVLMRGVLKAFAVTDRVVWVADSFEGLPKPDPQQSLSDAILYFLSKPLNRLKIPLEFAENTFRRYGLLDQQVKFLPGWFSDTLPTAPIRCLAVMRLDGDWYESTMVALNSLYSKLSAGGYIIIDDYGLPTGCRKAVDEFRSRYGIQETLQWVNKQVVFWQRLV
jgi:hypothetical protein